MHTCIHTHISRTHAYMYQYYQYTRMYAHSCTTARTHSHMCANFGASWSPRLVDIPDFLISDPLKPPKLPLGRDDFYSVHYHLELNLHVCAKFGPDRTTGDDMYTVGRIHTQTHTHSLYVHAYGHAHTQPWTVDKQTASLSVAI